MSHLKQGRKIVLARMPVLTDQDASVSFYAWRTRQNTLCLLQSFQSTSRRPNNSKRRQLLRLINTACNKTIHLLLRRNDYFPSVRSHWTQQTCAFLRNSWNHIYIHAWRLNSPAKTNSIRLSKERSLFIVVPHSDCAGGILGGWMSTCHGYTSITVEMGEELDEAYGTGHLRSALS